jgi:hypothetical protein
VIALSRVLRNQDAAEPDCNWWIFADMLAVKRRLCDTRRWRICFLEFLDPAGRDLKESHMQVTGQRNFPDH